MANYAAPHLASPLNGAADRSPHGSFANPSFTGPRTPMRPVSDRADDALPKGTVFRWNPYVATPTGASSNGVAHPAGSTPIGGDGTRLLPASTAAPVRIITPRSETAAAEYATTPHADDNLGSPPLPEGTNTLRSPLNNSLTTAPGPQQLSDGTFALREQTTDPTELLLKDLMSEQRDAAVRDRIVALPQDESQRLYRYLLHFPDMATQLCLKERGRIFADAIEAAATTLNNNELYRWLLARVDKFAVDQSGCIAISRVYDVVTPAQQAQLDDWVCVNFFELTAHQYGNYVVQRVITAGNKDIMDAMSRQLCSRGVVSALTQSKAGSHVVERFVSKAPLSAVVPLCRVMLADHDLITALADDRYGNYVLQAALRRVVAEASTVSATVETPPAATQPTSPLVSTTETPSPSANHRPKPTDAELRTLAASIAQECVEAVPGLVATSSNATNIHRALNIPPPASATASAQRSGDASSTAHVVSGGRISASALRRGRGPGSAARR